VTYEEQTIQCRYVITYLTSLIINHSTSLDCCDVHQHLTTQHSSLTDDRHELTHGTSYQLTASTTATDL